MLCCHCNFAGNTRIYFGYTEGEAIGKVTAITNRED